MLTLGGEELPVLVYNGLCEQRGIFVLVGELIFHLDDLVHFIRMRVVDEYGDGAVLRLCFVGAEREKGADLDVAQLGKSVSGERGRILLYRLDRGAGQDVVEFGE